MSVTLLDPILEAQGRPREAQDPPKRGPRGAQRGLKVGSKRDLILASFFQRFEVDFLIVFFDVFWYHFVGILMAILLPLIYENIDFYMCFCSRNWFTTFYEESSLKHFSDQNGRQFGIDFWSIFFIDFGMDFGTKNR